MERLSAKTFRGLNEKEEKELQAAERKTLAANIAYNLTHHPDTTMHPDFFVLLDQELKRRGYRLDAVNPEHMRLVKYLPRHV